jgi:hypothetical protein
MTKVKGSKITSKFSYLKSKHGTQSKAEVLAALDEGDRQALRLVLDVGWYPQELYVRLLSAICQTLGGGDEGIYAQIGEHTADHQFSHNYRAYHAGDLKETLENMVPLHSRLNDPGAMEVSLPEAGRATIVVSAPTSDPVICAVSRAFYRRALELHGVHDVQVRETECSGRDDRRCRYEIRWTS